MTEPPQGDSRKGKSSWHVGLRKSVLAAVGAVGLVVGAVLGTIQLVEWLGSVGKPAIRADYNFVNYPAEGVVVGEFDPRADPRSYLRKGRVAASYPYMYVEVTSQAERESVTLSPYLVVEVTDVRPMPKKTDYVTYPAGAGGAQLRYFSATLSPEREGIFYAPQWTPDTALNPFPAGYEPEVHDTFNLTPGNKEYLLLELTMLPGYYYSYRVGVQYSHGGEQRTEWDKEEHTVGVPLEATVYRQTANGAPFARYGDLQEYERYKAKENMPPLPRYGEGEVREAIRAQDEAVQGYGYPFTPPEQLREE